MSSSDDQPVYLTAGELMARWRMGKTAFYANIQRGKVPRPEEVGGQKLWSVQRIHEIEARARREADR